MRIPFLAATVAALLLTGAGCLGLGGEKVQIKPVTLEYWRTDDEAESMTSLIEAYRKLHPNVTINYKKFREEDFEQTLLEAFAESRGPDLFSVPNVSLRSWQPNLLPLPAETAIPSPVVTKDKKVANMNVKTPSLTIRQLIAAYVETVPGDVVLADAPKTSKDKPEEKIFGLPLSVETLALFYNRDLLKKAKIAQVPTTWRELQQQARELTVLGEDEKTIKQSGAALGTARNIERAAEIVATLMMQNGAIMSDEYGSAAFHERIPGKGDAVYPPGLEALLFYIQAADEKSIGYSWNASMPTSFDAFVSGKTAFVFGFPSDAKEIRSRASKLDFGIAPLPQIDPSKPAQMAVYPVEVVSKKTASPNEAWDFLQFISRADKVTEFLTATKRPTALRGVITGQMEDPDIAPFAGQVLAAKNWYHGLNYPKAREAFTYMIEARPTEESPEWEPIVGRGAGMVNATLY